MFKKSNKRRNRDLKSKEDYHECICRNMYNYSKSMFKKLNMQKDLELKVNENYHECIRRNIYDYSKSLL